MLGGDEILVRDHEKAKSALERSGFLYRPAAQLVLFPEIPEFREGYFFVPEYPYPVAHLKGHRLILIDYETLDDHVEDRLLDALDNVPCGQAVLR